MANAVPGVKQTSNIGGLLQGTGAQNLSFSTPAPLAPTAAKKTTTLANTGSSYLSDSIGTTQQLFDQLLSDRNTAVQGQLGLIDQQRGNLSSDFIRQLVGNVGFDSARQVAGQYGLAVGDEYNTGGPSAYDTSRQQYQGQARQANAEIDQAYNQYAGQAEASKTQASEDAARGSVQVEDALQRNFASRGALDSSFFAKALAQGVGGINEAKVKQIGAVNSALQNALQQTQLQHQKVDQQLSDLTNELDTRKNSFLQQVGSAYNSGKLSYDQAQQALQSEAAQFATETELQKMNTLNSLKSNLASLTQSYQTSQQDLMAQFQSLTGVNSLTPDAVQQAAQNAYYIAQNPNGGRTNLQNSFTSAGLDPNAVNGQIQSAEAYIANNPQLQALIKQNGGK